MEWTENKHRKVEITWVEYGKRDIRRERHEAIRCGGRPLGILWAGDSYKYLGVRLNMLGNWEEEKGTAIKELDRRIKALLATPLTPNATAEDPRARGPEFSKTTCVKTNSPL